MVTYVIAVHDTEHTVWDILAEERLLAVTVIKDGAGAEPLGTALVAGGLRCVEVTLRTESALSAIATMSGHDGLVVGAGTVISPAQADEAISAGAQFVVSPGFDAGVVQLCQERGVPVFPGVATPTEIMMALSAGLDTVKFFPAGLLGGPPMVKALSGPFPAVRFIPTGGVDAANASEYLALSNVVAVGGTWMVPASLLDAGDWSEVERLTRAAGAAVRPGTRSRG
jgi:2-dehydro-3-deoxyphosphogluconate aldolase/(4S)-4-hydroxy-2-oxoglutarate aldolase